MKLKLNGLKPNLKLRLTLNYKNVDGSPVVVTSTVERIEKNGNLLIYAPLRLGRYVEFRKHEEFSISFLDDNNNLMTFRVSYVKNEEHSGIPYVLVKPITDLMRIQQREDYRVKTHIGVVLHYEDYSEPALMSDISGGGLGLYTNVDLSVGDEISVDIMANKLHEQLTGTVMHIRPLFTDEQTIWKFTAGIRFIYKSSAQKDKIVRFVFEQQRERVRSLV